MVMTYDRARVTTRAGRVSVETMRVVDTALPPDVESPLVGALDRCWREMSAAEQDEAERLYARGRTVVAPDLLAIEDQEVAVGDHVGPRRAA